MTRSWAQTSLSRDFALLAATILFALGIISTILTYTNYDLHKAHVAEEMSKESHRVEQALNAEMQTANYMLNALAKYIVLDPDRNLTKLAQLLKSFDSREHIYSILSWVNPKQMLVVSSNLGVLENPVDVSDREHIKRALADPWKMAVGEPIEGRVSGQWVIPVAMGVTDYTGKFIGIISISINIGMLTDRIASQFKRDGMSITILSKSLTSMLQIGDDKDSSNFQLHKLDNIDVSKSPDGLIPQGNSFWNSGNFAYYHASDSYPYIVLLSYDNFYSVDATRGMLRWRLLEIFALGIFFVAFLWIVRLRMIAPVIALTNVAASVAKGQACTFPLRHGPVEIENLAIQIHRIFEYIQETKRIHDELRNKMFMMKKARDMADIDSRSQSEFLAYMCQEMRTPLNNIIGGAQVMKDQLYGPIDNRKYRQYVNEIYTTGNVLLDSTQDLITLAKAQTDYIELVEKPVEITEAINKTLRFLSDKLQAENLGIKVHLHDPIPQLIADEFRLQQILMNVLSHAFDHVLPDSTIMLEARLVTEGRDKTYFAFVINSGGTVFYNNAELFALAEKLSTAQEHRWVVNVMELLKKQTDIGLELAKKLVALHGGTIDIAKSTDNTVAIAIFFSGNRIRFTDTQDV